LLQKRRYQCSLDGDRVVRHHGVTVDRGGHLMLLTSAQHRGIAKILRQKAAKLPAAMKDRANRMRQSADLHTALARAQDNNPALAPKSDPNQSLPKSPSPSLAPSLPGESPNN
jgi:hypothetical protein